jgi:hypothetical protein
MNEENSTIEAPEEATQVDTATEAPTTEVAQEEVKKNNHNSYEQRLKKMTWQKHETSRNHEKALGDKDARIAELEENARIKVKPVEENYENYKDFDRDNDKFNAQTKAKSDTEFNKRVAEGIADAKDKASREKRAEKYNEKREKAFTNFTDFGNSEATVNEALQGRVDIVELIIESENSDKIVDYYGKHPEALAKLQNASLVSAVRQVDSVSIQNLAPTSQAPAPTDNKASGSSGEKDPLKMSFTEYCKWRNGK